MDVLLLLAYGLHVVVDGPGVDPWWARPFRSATLWNGGQDGSLLEHFGQLQTALAAILLFGFARRGSRWQVLPVLGGVLLLLVADDLFGLHERTGRALAPMLHGSGLHLEGAQEVGGLLLWVAVGVVGAAGLLPAAARSCPEARRIARKLLLVAVPLVIVAVGYVAFRAVAPEPVYEELVDIAVAVRVTTKLLTATAILSAVLHARHRRPPWST
ncbi:hypothetical protein ACH9D2_13340 [Kocuria sp. M4R2S49]|uniref:hypothetical protein n=1 Tax=Kocuria rhizosphaericola TaxID=3376284 RepID=UPI00378C8F97